MAETVLITGARAAVALDLARDFRCAGYEVHMADSVPCLMARGSRAVTAFHRLASPRQQPDQYRRDMQAVIQSLNPVRVIPTCEEVFHLAHTDMAGFIGDRLFAPPKNLLRTLHDKYLFNRLIADAGIKAPETRLLRDRADVLGLAKEAGNWVFKPCFSRFGTRVLVGPASALLPTIAPQETQPWIAQRRIRGTEYSFYAVARNGTIMAFAAYGSAWRLRGGASFVFTPAPQDVGEKLAEIATGVACATGLTGQFSCDVIVDDKGRAWPIECNPRATSGLHFLTGTGALARLMAGQGQGVLRSDDQPRFLQAAMWSYGLALAARRGRWRAWWSQIYEGRDVIGAPADRWPVVGAIFDAVRFEAQGRRLGLTAMQVSTADIEWNGE